MGLSVLLGCFFVPYFMTDFGGVFLCSISLFCNLMVFVFLDFGLFVD